MPANTFHIERLPTIQRLPAYLHLLKGFAREGRVSISATELGKEMGVQAIVARKDMAMAGVPGRPRIGFPVTELIAAIEAFLGWDRTTDAILAGVGHLGTALLGYEGFSGLGLEIAAAFDIDPEKVDSTIHGKPILPLTKLVNVTRRMEIHLGILAVPAGAAQEVANLMVEAGIRGIWNFSPTALQLPAGILCQDQNLAMGLAVLSSQLKKRDGR